jgi:hypothetical protein
MRTRFVFVFPLILIFFVFVLQPACSQNSLSLDQAIGEVAAYFINLIPNGAKVALNSFETPSGRFSDYVFEEMWSRFEKSRKFLMVDRRNQDRIDAEIKHQYESGKVDDNQAVSMTHQYGAEIIVYGQVTPLGQEYRLTAYSTDVEKAGSSQCVVMIKPDNRLSALLVSSPDDEVERAVTVMARALNQKTTIALGKIAYLGTGSVSSLSAWLKQRIIQSAQKQQAKFQVASESEANDFAVSSRGLTVEEAVSNSAIQAVVAGTYSYRDFDAEITLQLISTGGNKVVLASTHFIIPASELERRKLSILPPKDNSVISRAEYEARQKAVEPYAGKNNQWVFTVTPDVLDNIYHDGDEMFFLLYSSRECYFKITHVDVNGSTQIIYPFSQNDNNLIRAGQTRRIPDNTRFRMGPPFGEEMILVAAYDRPFIANRQSGSLNADSITRSMAAETDTHSQINPLATAKFSYTVLPR